MVRCAACVWVPTCACMRESMLVRGAIEPMDFAGKKHQALQHAHVSAVGPCVRVCVFSKHMCCQRWPPGLLHRAVHCGGVPWRRTVLLLLAP